MSKKKIIIIILILGIIATIFLVKTGSKDAVTNNLGVTETDSTLGRDFMSALMGVENVVLDVSLFKSPIFKSLIPSGAYVDPNPPKGKADPFADTSGIKTNADTNIVNSLRDFGFGESSPTDSVFIRISNITKSTGAIAVVGIPANQVVTLILLNNDGVIIPVDLTYKNGEYSGVATSLKSLTTYTARIQSPEIYSGLQADFTTK